MPKQNPDRVDYMNFIEHLNEILSDYEINNLSIS